MEKYFSQHSQSSLNIDILNKYKTDIFIETGSNMGEAISLALKLNFDKIFSCEPEKTFYNFCRAKFSKKTNVMLFNDRSENILPFIINNIDKQSTFWLDGHGYQDIPLLKELEIIKQSSRNDHIILIDDCRMFNSIDWNFLSKKDVIKYLFKINKNYNISYEDSINGEKDIMVATIL